MSATDERTTRANTELRRTGLPPIAKVPWGAHICMFYETPEDLIDAHAAYFGAGLADNEYCIWVLSDPVDRDRAITEFRKAIPLFDDYLAAGVIELISGYEFFLDGDKFDPRHITGRWREKLNEVLARGFEGLRVSGNAFWMETDLWDRFLEFEEDLDSSLEGAAMVVLCTYPLGAASAVNMLDVARTHQVSIGLRDGQWESLEPAAPPAARREAGWAAVAADILSRPFPGHDRLTPRERDALAEIVRGASNKEAARALGISPRTAEFHRTNIMRKFKARNAVELVGIVLGAA